MNTRSFVLLAVFGYVLLAVLLSSCACAPPAAAAATATGVLGVGELVVTGLTESGVMDKVSGSVFLNVLHSFQHALDGFSSLQNSVADAAAAAKAATTGVADLKSGMMTPLEVAGIGAAGGAAGAGTAGTVGAAVKGARRVAGAKPAG